MPINLTAVAQDLDTENHRLMEKVTEIGKRVDITDTEKGFAALIAIEMSIHNRLGDMILLQLQTGR